MGRALATPRDCVENLQEQSLYAKMSKCEFGMKELLYLRHIIGKDGVKVHMEKIRAILEWPSPKNITKLRGFIGICTYYRKFVKGFSKLTSPLTDLTKKDCIYVVVDRNTKFSHLFVVTSSFSAAQVADLFFKEIFRLHGLPKSIVSDRDGRFMSDFWKELIDKLPSPN